MSKDLHAAEQEARETGITIVSGFNFQQNYDVYIDALFGIGLNRALNAEWQHIIQRVNTQDGLKISIDIPSGLQANSGQPLPCAIKADYTFTALGLKSRPIYRTRQRIWGNRNGDSSFTCG